MFVICKHTVKAELRGEEMCSISRNVTHLVHYNNVSDDISIIYVKTLSND